MLERLLGPLAARWDWLRTALDVQKRVAELHGGYLASAVTLAAFLSLFPLLLLIVALVGFLSFNGAEVTTAVVDRLGLSGEAATAVVSAIDTAEKSRKAASIVGVVGLLWSGLGLVAAMQYVWDVSWQVTGRGIRDRLQGLLWLGGGVVIFLGSVALTALINVFPSFLPVTLVAGLAVSFGLWMWTHKVMTRVHVPWRALVPGAILGAVGLEILKLVGSVYVPRAITASSGLYGSIGAVFATLAWLLFFGRLIVYSAVLNVVRWEEGHGTITAEIELPRYPDEQTIGTTRAGEARRPEDTKTPA